MDEEDDEVALSEGMPIKNEAGEDLGTLGALLVAEEEDQAEFLILRRGATERLVPFEAVLGVGDGELLLDVPVANVDRFPALRKDEDPTEAEMELAYQVYDEGAATEADDV